MPYATPTFAALKAALAARLGDADAVFWTDAEMGRYLIEAIRVFNALAQFWRERGVFPTVADQLTYDLNTELPTLRGMTVTDRELVTDIGYQFMEPDALASWGPQFTVANAVAALERRRNQFLLETGIVVTASVLPDQPPTVTRFALPADVIALRRVGWLNADGEETALTREDEWAFNVFSANWNLAPAQTPLAYSVGTTPPLQLQIAPAPFYESVLRILAVENGPSLDPDTETALGLPNDWAWVVRYGAMADLLAQDGIGRDVPRATYCDQRYREGVALAKVANILVGATVNDVNVFVNSLEEADRFDAGWSNRSGQPEQLLTAGMNIVAFAPVPSGVSSITVDVVRNAPIPTVDADVVQLPQDVLDGILDYAEHIATFKEGGADFQRTQAVVDRFYRLCGVDMATLRATVPNLDLLTQGRQRDLAYVPQSRPEASA